MNAEKYRDAEFNRGRELILGDIRVRGESAVAALPGTDVDINKFTSKRTRSKLNFDSDVTKQIQKDNLHYNPIVTYLVNPENSPSSSAAVPIYTCCCC